MFPATKNSASSTPPDNRTTVCHRCRESLPKAVSTCPSCGTRLRSTAYRICMKVLEILVIVLGVFAFSAISQCMCQELLTKYHVESEATGLLNVSSSSNIRFPNSS